MNGLTLRADHGPYIVTAISPTQHFYTDTGLSSAVTLPATITSTTTWYCAPAYSDFYTFTCTQLDGSDISPGVPQWVGTTADSTLNPRPTLGQLSTDTQNLRLPSGFLRSGYYYAAGQAAAATTNAPTLNQIRVHPWIVPNRVTLSKLGAEVTSAGTAGSVFRLGIWADNGSGYPGSLLVDAGTIDGTSATVQEVTCTQQLDAGVYWIGGAAQVAAPTMRAHSVNASSVFPIILGSSAPSSGYSFGWYAENSVTGAFGATFGSTPTPGPVGQMPRIHFKVG